MVRRAQIAGECASLVLLSAESGGLVLTAAKWCDRWRETKQCTKHPPSVQGAIWRLEQRQESVSLAFNLHSEDSHRPWVHIASGAEVYRISSTATTTCEVRTKASERSRQRTCHGKYLVCQLSMLSANMRGCGEMSRAPEMSYLIRRAGDVGCRSLKGDVHMVWSAAAVPDLVTPTGLFLWKYLTISAQGSHIPGSPVVHIGFRRS